MIANRIMAYLETDGLDVADLYLNQAATSCRESMRRNLGLRRDDGTRKIRKPRPSGAWACGREMVFNSLGLETEGYGWRSRLTFTHGDMTEAMGVLLFRQAIAASGENDMLISPFENGDQLELDVVTGCRRSVLHMVGKRTIRVCCPSSLVHDDAAPSGAQCCKTRLPGRRK